MELEYKYLIADILLLNGKTTLTDLIKQATKKDVYENRARVIDSLLTDLSYFQVWGVITRETIGNEVIITLTKSGKEQIETVNKMRSKNEYFRN